MLQLKEEEEQQQHRARLIEVYSGSYETVTAMLLAFNRSINRWMKGSI
jgi:hypothetical protein